MFDANLMVMLAGAADPEAVLARFARQVGIEEPSSDRSALLVQLYERLAVVREEGRHTVLILDDAHILGREAMAEVCGLLNLEYEDRRLLSLLLVGVPDLDVTLSHDPSLAARVDVRVHLSPLDLPSSRAYLAHRLAVVGGTPDVFTEAAVAALFKFGRGRPRLLNTLADNALFETYLEGRSRVDAPHVERSAADLGVACDPGHTYSGIPSGRVPTAPAAPPGGVRARADATVPEGFDPNEDSALELSNVAAPGDDDDIDLGSLLEGGMGIGGEADLTTVLAMDTPAPDASTRDLDADMEAALAEIEAPSEDLPIFATRNSRPSRAAEPTRVSFDASPGDGDNIDDLFVELIEE
jgi:hypothetical protein